METNKQSQQTGTRRAAEVVDGPQASLPDNPPLPGSLPDALPEEETTVAESDGEQQNRVIEEYRRDKEELYDRLLRKQAEFDNYRKRQEKEKKEIATFARSEVFREILPVADACERALKAMTAKENSPSSSESYRSGVELIYKRFLDALARFDVRPIESLGQPFDPLLHDAIMREETDLYPENRIIEELQKGYTCENRLLRPAQVKVATPRPSRAVVKGS
jgi:molecular chaperone GrpE